MSAIYLVGQGGVLTGPITLLVVPGIGPQMPDSAVEVAQELNAAPKGQAWVLVQGAPVLLADHRGTVYSTSTGEPEEFEALGELPEGLTLDPPPGPFYVWQSGAWQLDAAAQAADQMIKVRGERDSLMATAQLRIAPLKYAADLDMATEPEKSGLLAWMRYSVDLNRVEQQPGYPLVVEWPVPPAVTATA